MSSNRRGEEIRAQWRAHLEAQRSSGQTQSAYCRAQGLDPRYFSVWKSKLKELEGSRQPALQLIPLVIAKSSSVDASDVAPLTIHLRLPNGLSVSLSIPSVSALPCVLEQLAHVPC